MSQLQTGAPGDSLDEPIDIYETAPAPVPAPVPVPVPAPAPVPVPVPVVPAPPVPAPAQVPAPEMDIGMYRKQKTFEDGDCAYAAIISASVDLGNNKSEIEQIPGLFARRKRIWNKIFGLDDAQERAEELRHQLHLVLQRDNIRGWLVRGFSESEVAQATTRIFIGTLVDGKGTVGSFAENTELLILSRLFGVVIAVYNADASTDDKWVFFNGKSSSNSGFVGGFSTGEPANDTLWGNPIIWLYLSNEHYDALLPRGNSRSKRVRGGAAGATPQPK